MHRITPLFVTAFAVATTLCSPVAAQSVAANQATVTDLGFFAAGTYALTGSGLVDLVGPPGSGFTMRPDGIPDSPVTIAGYDYFNPNGSYTANGAFGLGGATIKIGALMGTLVAAPAASDFFLIGYGTTISLASAGHIYAQVNDNFYPNNGGAFTVDVAAVPEPAVWGMLVGGFGMAGFAIRRRRAVTLRYA
jgi:hypothetical protein